MAKLLKLRRGTTSQHSSFTGAEGEVTVDTTKDTLVVHDGSTAGGHPIAKESANLSLIDEDNMATNSDSRPPSQQSVKAYADTKASPPASAGTVGTSETVQVDSNKDIAGFRNVTLTGELDAATGDFSGDVDVDGTLEADAVTVNGTALNEYIADTVGAMVTGNTETGITVTYEDGDNTLDFVVGNSATTTTATNVDVTANNSTDETVYPTFVDGATGAQGIETDTGFTYNPNTGLITAVGLTLSGNLTVNGTTTTINSTTLAVDDKNIELGTVDTPSDTTADGGGITLKGASDKTFNWVDATDAWTSSEHVHLGDSKKLLLGTGSDLEIYHDGTYSYLKNNTSQLRVQSATFGVQKTDGSEAIIWGDADGAVALYHDGSQKLSTSAAGVTVTGTVTDSKGDVRSIPQNTQGSAYELLAADAGKHILASGNITWVDSRHAAGDAITIVNNTSGNITITKGTTMYNTADGTNANRTLATRGMATILWTSGTVAYISGAGLS